MASRVAEEAKDLREFLDQLRSEPGYWKHFTILQFTTAMARLLNKPPRVSGKKLAGLLGVKPSSVSRALSGGENLTVETMTKLAGAIDAAVHIHVAKKGILVTWREEGLGREILLKPVVSLPAQEPHVFTLRWSGTPPVSFPETNVGATILANFN